MATNGFERILVATDGSEAANAAVDLAGSLARSSGGSIRVVHVWQLEIHHRHTPADLAARSEAEHLIEQAIERLHPFGVEATGQLTHADGRHVAAMIAEVAREFRPDLLVTGARGLSDWHSLVQHSVSHELLTTMDCPILIVRAGSTSSAAGPRRVLLALAGDDDVAPGVEAASAVATTPGSRVLVVHVGWSVTSEHGMSIEEPEARRRAIVDSALGALHDAGIEADAWILRPAPVAASLADAASRWQADLIVLGSSRLGDVGSMLLGSVTHDLLRRTDLPVLVSERVRNQEPVTEAPSGPAEPSQERDFAVPTEA